MADGDPDELDELDPVDPPKDDDDDDGAAADPVEGDDPAQDDQPAAAASTGDQPQDQGDQQQPERRTSRENDRVRTLREQVKERDQRLAETNRRLDEIIRAQAQPQQRGETPEQRAQRHALMSPQDIMDERLREAEQRFEARINATTFMNAEMADRTAFQAKAAVDPIYAKWGPKVEALLAERAAKGQPPVEREVAIRWLLGDTMLKQRGSKEGKREVRDAQRRVANQRTRPPNSGSDTQPQRRQAQSLERRLETVQI